MAYDAIRQRYPEAPAVVGARVRQKLSGRLGSIVPPRAGDAGLRVHFDGHFPPESCDPRALEYAHPPPRPGPEWRLR